MGQDLLSDIAAAGVYFEPLRGNHGDRLLRMAAESLLAQSDVVLVEKASQAQTILLNGGGSMSENWFGLAILEDYSRRYPDTPLVVWPSSWHVSHLRLSELLKPRRAPTTLWARERPSLELLQQARLADNIRVALAPDLALRLKTQPPIQGATVKPSHILVVERDDWEGPTGRKRPFAIKGLEVIPERIRRTARKALLGKLRKRQDDSAFARAALDLVRRRHPELQALPVTIADVSLPEVCDFSQFLKHVSRAAAIVSTRLHVAILGFLWGRPTYLVEGRYHKYRGVFEHSLSGGTVRLARWNPERSTLEL